VELRVAFFGTPETAVPSLERLLAAGFDVPVVITQPDRPKGRGRQPAASPVKQFAVERGLPVWQPETLKNPELIEALGSLGLDAMAVVAYGKIIPQAIIDIPPLGIVNVHFSLLPAYRGAAPVQWAIAAGETRTGVTTMRIDAGLDTGDILLTAETEIGPDETAIELGERLAAMGADLLVETLRALSLGQITPRPQEHARATYAPMLKKEDGRIDFTWPALKIHNRVRGFQPWPGAYCTFRGRILHLWRTRLAAEQPGGSPGTLHALGRRLLVTCGDGAALELVEVQLEGRKRLSAEAFLIGQHLEPGERLEPAPLDRSASG
jgi:methionyl-tRNA formyltransferase